MTRARVPALVLVVAFVPPPASAQEESVGIDQLCGPGTGIECPSRASEVEQLPTDRGAHVRPEAKEGMSTEDFLRRREAERRAEEAEQRRRELFSVTGDPDAREAVDPETSP